MRNESTGDLLLVKTDDLEPWEKLDRAIGHRNCLIIGWATLTDWRITHHESIEDLGKDVWRLK
jgi:hypothetical protein